jgi:uncharacterized protein YeeX (DUF496 family)
MAVVDKDKIYTEISDLEKKIRKAHPKQEGRVMIANAKSYIDATVGRVSTLNEAKWLLEYRDKLKTIV